MQQALSYKAGDEYLKRVRRVKVTKAVYSSMLRAVLIHWMRIHYLPRVLKVSH